jgi:hypothetical protein
MVGKTGVRNRKPGTGMAASSLKTVAGRPNGVKIWVTEIDNNSKGIVIIYMEFLKP